MSGHAALIGALFSGLAVALGAFGAHALKSRLEPAMLEVWKTAVEYQFYHALALILLGLFARQMKTTVLDASAICFIVGILLFSGSLYALCLSGVRVLGAITPIGGLLFLVGWTCFAYGLFRTGA
ncbi:MAG: DUF423 domain-containing protein [Panacagrimonas sp.]